MAYRDTDKFSSSHLSFRRVETTLKVFRKNFLIFNQDREEIKQTRKIKAKERETNFDQFSYTFLIS